MWQKLLAFPAGMLSLCRQQSWNQAAWGLEEGGDHESIPVPTEDGWSWCLVPCPASEGLSQCLLHKESSNFI